ncbi:MAG: hypothetical protein ABIJ31_16100, partial [Pseudomonadota bacterium]
TENPCLDENLSICKAQAKLKPECTVVHEDFSFAQQRSRWMSFRSNTILSMILCIYNMAEK